jgi:hypothetical protein
VLSRSTHEAIGYVAGLVVGAGLDVDVAHSCAAAFRERIESEVESMLCADRRAYT